MEQEATVHAETVARIKISSMTREDLSSLTRILRTAFSLFIVALLAEFFSLESDLGTSQSAPAVLPLCTIMVRPKGSTATAGGRGSAGRRYACKAVRSLRGDSGESTRLQGHSASVLLLSQTRLHARALRIRLSMLMLD